MRNPRDRVQWVYAAKNNRELEARYDEWASDYDRDLAVEFEWASPRVAIGLFAKHVALDATILDAGAGTGLVGEHLVAAGYRGACAIDLSPRMLEVARRKQVYGDLRQMTLGEPLGFDTDVFDAVIAVGVFTTGHAPAHAFDELVRITRPGGHIVFSLRTELEEEPEFAAHFESLGGTGKWNLVECSEPYHPLPKGEPEVEHRTWVYRIV